MHRYLSYALMRKQSVLESVSHRKNTGVVPNAVTARLFQSVSDCDYSGSVESARSSAALLFSAVHKSFALHSVAFVKYTDSLRTVKLMPAERKHIRMRLAHVKVEMPSRLHRVGMEDD